MTAETSNARGEVVAERHALYGIRWVKQLRDMRPGTQWFIEGREWPIATVTSSAGVLWHMAESEIPHGTKYYTAPPPAAAQQQGQAVACVACEDKPVPGNNPCGWCGRTTPQPMQQGGGEVVEKPCRRCGHGVFAWANEEGALCLDCTAPPSAPVGVEAAEAMGARGGPASESERLAFEAWMRGHCWALCATWNGTEYRSDAEQGGRYCSDAARTRMLWAAWRDRATLAQQPAAVDEAARWMTAILTYASGLSDGQLRAIESAALAGQQPAAVDGAMVCRLAVWMAKQDGHDDPHHLIWEGSPPEPWGEIWMRYEGDARSALTAALAAQHQEPTT